MSQIPNETRITPPNTQQESQLTPRNSGTTNSACDGDSSSGQTLVNPLKGICSIPQLLVAVLKAVVQLGIIVITLALIWVGFLFVAARGNPESISKAKSALVWTIIGGLIILGAQAIALVVESTVNSLR